MFDGNRRKENGNRRPETGNRRQETGDLEEGIMLTYRSPSSTFKSA